MSTDLSESMSSEVKHLGPVLADEMLMRFHQRTPIYDRENRIVKDVMAQ